MLNENLLIQKYNNSPEWLRWILFLPISFIISTITWFFLDSSARMIGAYELVLDVLHPVIFQVLFLFLVFHTIPRVRLRAIKILIILRSLILLFFVASPVLVFLGIEQVFDFIFFKKLTGEIITLLASFSLFKELRKDITIK